MSDQTDLKPILPDMEDELPGIESDLNLESIEEGSGIDDKKIRDIGWRRYGEKLSKSNRKGKKKDN